MKVYADRLPVAMRQVVTDLLVVAWVYASVRGTLWFYDLVNRLAVPGQKLESAGGGLADNLGTASAKVGRVPVVGDDLTAPFQRAAAAARTMAEAGADQQDLIRHLALALAIAVLVIAVAPTVFVWLPLRVRWMRRASTAARLRAQPTGLDLLALRALTDKPLRALYRIDPDVVGAWRRGDDVTVRKLAALELRGLGLRVRDRPVADAPVTGNEDVA